MFKNYLLFIISIAISFTVPAQSKVISGYLLDSLTHFGIADGTVTNGTAGKSAKTGEKGFFRIKAAPNDFIYATAKSYHYDTMVYSYIFTDTITIYLSPAGNVLPNVTVTTKLNKYQLDSVERKTSFEQDMGKPMKTLSSNHETGFGLTFNLDKVFKKKYRDREKAEKMFEVREKLAYIDYRFSPYIVTYYTHLKGDDLRDFLRRYTPNYNWLRQHPNDEDVMLYINDKLKAWHALKSH